MELILILVVALMVFGPRRLPEIGAALGKAIREFREMSEDVTSDIARELEATREAALDQGAGESAEGEHATSEEKDTATRG
jgi:TatA/E family protein of Tat protein translocase